MNKKHLSLIVLISVVLTLLVNIFFGRYVTAKISTWPLLNRWKILSPQAPIVINNNQTVRVSDTGDAGQIAGQLKSKLSSVALVSNGTVTLAGSAVNLTSDGSFVTAASTFNSKIASGYFVVLSDGTNAQVSQITVDPATSLAFFKASLNQVPVQNMAKSQDVLVGDKIFFVQNSLQNFAAKISGVLVAGTQNDVEGQVYQSDYFRRGFISAGTGATLGAAVVNGSGNIVGIWNGSAVISSDVLSGAMALYFNNPSDISRPSFGFSYLLLTSIDSKLTGAPEGALVKSVAAVSAARTAGLETGDVIISVDGQNISQNNPLEPMLEKYHPGDAAAFTVTRGKNQLSLKLTAGELK